MSSILSVGQLIDRSWEHTRNHLRDLLKVSAWFLVPTALAVVSALLYPSASTLASGKDLTPFESLAVFLWLANAAIVIPAVVLGIFIDLMKLIQAQERGTPIRMPALLQDVRRLFWPALLVNILVLGLLVASWLLTLPGAGLAGLGSLWNNEALAAMGGLLLMAGMVTGIVLGIWWLIVYGYAPLALVLENQRGRGALRRSRELIAGRFWAVVARMAIPKIIYLLIGIVAEVFVNQLGEIAIESIGGVHPDVQVRLTMIFTTLVVVVGAAILNPLMLTSDYLLYQSLKDSRAEESGKSKKTLV
ncbi:hypothetical protein HY734_01435 [Candidatus Uhrbacteria bacterium]|nr:hypothetical protein [Candidatus Uhrbacteria bacterium]